MLEWRRWGIRFRVSILFPALVTALLLQQPDGLAVGCVLASLLHEGGHLAAMLVLHCPPHSVTVGAFGARLEMGQDALPGYRRNLLISLAGPTVNILLAGLFWGLGQGQTAAVHLCLGLFNLLPAAPLDGGQVVWCVCCLAGRECGADRLLRWCSAGVLLPLAAAAGWLWLSGGNVTLLLVSAYLSCLVFFA